VTAIRSAAPAARLPALRVPDRVRVVGVAVLVAAIQVGITAVAAPHQDGVRSLDAGAIALLLAGPAALLVRRRHPVATYLVAFVAAMAYDLANYPEGPVFLALMAAFVNVVMRGHRAVGWAGLAVGYVIAGWIDPLVRDEGPWPDWTTAAALAAWLLVLGAGTELARSWLERAAERAMTEAEEARRRASEERLRIARELHDVLAHNISLINVRAGVALHLVDERPDRIDADQVRPALAAIKDASKDALGELRSVLAVLRQDEGDAAPLAPTAGLTDLDALAERARGTGLDVQVERRDGATAGTPATGAFADLPAGVDLAAFRIAQEALTNVVRHAAATRAVVRVRRDDAQLEVEVDDDGVGATVPAGRPVSDRDAPDGRGIAGMRERALALGGTLEAGPRPGRGFRVRARFPLRDDA
jgi:signal transduction histidine kinase